MSDPNVPATPSTPADAISAPAQPVATPQAPSAPTIGTQPQTPAIGAPQPEDRSNWVPPHRLRETREAAIREAQRQWAEREAAIQHQLEQAQSQLRALVGVSQPQNPEVDAIRQQFGQLYPGLSKLEERAQDLMSVLERAGDLETQNAHYWQSYGRQTMDRLFAKASETIGSPLTDEGKRALHAAFVGYVQQSPELSDRYSSDPTIVDDFWKAFSSNLIDPVRRTQAAAIQSRVPQGLPQDTPAGIPSTPGAPKPQSLDERADRAWAAYQSTATRR